LYCYAVAPELTRMLLALLQRPPPVGRRLAVVATTSSPKACAALGLSAAFHATVAVPALSRDEAENVLAVTGGALQVECRCWT
jgi:vesicle-fusing ATPase